MKGLCRSSGPSQRSWRSQVPNIWWRCATTRYGGRGRCPPRSKRPCSCPAAWTGILAVRHIPRCHHPGGFLGSRTFAFTDKLDVTNRLYWNLLSAEGWRTPTRPTGACPRLPSAHLRAEEQVRRPPTERRALRDREPVGQWWWLPEQLGWDLAADTQLDVGRTSSQDTGVSERTDIIVATATLEVGYDDDRVGAVLQHKAPHDAGQFLQRRGRAGRDPADAAVDGRGAVRLGPGPAGLATVRGPVRPRTAGALSTAREPVCPAYAGRVRADGLVGRPTQPDRSREVCLDRSRRAGRFDRAERRGA